MPEVYDSGNVMSLDNDEELKDVTPINGDDEDLKRVIPKGMNDSEIIELYFARDERAISETQGKYDSYLRTVSGKIIKSSEDVSECVNDTYLGAWNAIPPTRPNIFRIFLARITRNLSLKKLRSAYAEKRGGGEAALTLDELEEVVESGSRIDEELEAKELAGMIDEFLAGRAVVDRKIFISRYWYFDSIKEIADRFSFTESKVKMTLKRSRDDLKSYLETRGVVI